MIFRIQPRSIPFTTDRETIENRCRARYPRHPHGCPNFGRKPGCPGDPDNPVPTIDEVIDFSRDAYVIYVGFNIGRYVEESLKPRHPDWTDRQLYNLRYWQPKARKILRQEEARAVEEFELTELLKNPEAAGVNVGVLMAMIGSPMKWGWPPVHDHEDNNYLRNIRYQVSIGGYSRE